MGHKLGLTFGLQSGAPAGPAQGVNLSSMEYAHPTVRYGQSTWVNLNYTIPRQNDITWLAQQGYTKNRFCMLWELLQPALVDESGNGAGPGPSTTVLAGMRIAVAGDMVAQQMKYILDVLDFHANVGIKCLLDLHNYCRYRSFIYQSNGSVIGFTVPSNPLIAPYTTDPAQVRERIMALNWAAAPTLTINQSNFNAFWTKFINYVEPGTGRTVKQHPGLAGYGLMNEPNQMPVAGGTTANGVPEDLTIWVQFAQSAVNAIRAVDPTTPIYVSGNQWSTAWTGNPGGSYLALNPGFPLAGTGLIYEGHFYLDSRSNGARYDWPFEFAEPFCAGESGVNGARVTTGATRAQYMIDYAALGNKFAVTEMGMPVNDLNWQTSAQTAVNNCFNNNLEMFVWAGGNHWPNQDFSLCAVPNFKAPGITYDPLINGILHKAANRTGKYTIFADADKNFGAAATVCTVTVYARGYVDAAKTINLVRTGTGTLSAASVVLPAGANPSVTFTYTTAGTEDAFVTFSNQPQVPPVMHFYSMDPVTYAATDEVIAGRACLAKYNAREWLASNTFTDYMIGIPTGVANAQSNSGLLHGLNLHDGGTSTAENTTIAGILAARNFKHNRMDFIHDANQALPRDLITKIKTNGGTVEMVFQNQFQWDHTVYSDLAWVELQSYTQTFFAVNGMKDLVLDYEMLNEVQYRSEINVAGVVPINTAGTSTTLYEGKPAVANLVAILKGISRAIRQIALDSGRPLRILTNVVGRDFGWIQHLINQGVQFDVIVWHVYPRNTEASLKTDTWYGPGGPLAVLGTFGKPVHINEFNAGEIYDAYENVVGQPVTEQGFLSNIKHARDLYTQTLCNLDVLTWYELKDRPAQPVPENRFGLMFDLATPKPSLHIATAFAGGSLTTAERAQITSRGMTETEINAMRGANPRAIFNSGFGENYFNADGMKIWIEPRYDTVNNALPFLGSDANGKNFIDFSANNTWGFWSKKRSTNQSGANTENTPVNIVPYLNTDNFFQIASVAIPTQTTNGVIFATNNVESQEKATLCVNAGKAGMEIRGPSGAVTLVEDTLPMAVNTPHIITQKSVPGSQLLRVDGAQKGTSALTPAAGAFSSQEIGFIYDNYFPYMGWGGKFYGAVCGKGAPTNAELFVMEQYLALLSGTTLAPPAADYPAGVAGLTSWYDPSKLDNLRSERDTGGAVTAAGQLVGRIINRKSGGIDLTCGNAQRGALQNAGALWWMDGAGGPDWDSMANGGATTAFYFTRAFKLVAGFYSTLWTDRNSQYAGYAIFYNGANDRIEFSVGTGAALVIVSSSEAVGFTTGGPHVVTCWDDGASIHIQLNNGAIASAAHGAVSAGGTVYVNKQDAIGTNFTYAHDYGQLWANNVLPSAPDRAGIKTWLGAKAGLTL